jgi:hypothetical protein
LNSSNPSKNKGIEKQKKNTPLKDLKIHTLLAKKYYVDAVLQSALIVVLRHDLIYPVLSSPPPMFCNFSFGCCLLKIIKLGINAVARDSIIGG